MQSITTHLVGDFSPISPEIIIDLFQQFRSSKDEQIQNVSKQLLYYQENFPGEVLTISANFLLTDSLEDYIYQFSSIYINNIISPTRYISMAKNHFTFWKKLDKDVRTTIIEGTLRGLMFENQTVRNLCARVISLIGRMEVNNTSQFDFFENIFKIILEDEYGEWAKLGGIQAITEILSLDTKKDTVIPSSANREEIGSTIFQITTMTLQNPEVSAEFQNVAINCLRFALPIFSESIKDQFDTLLEFILSLLPIGLSAYQLLLKFTKVFYDQLLPDPIKLIFDEVSKDISSEDLNRKLLSINFWYRFSKHEFKLLNAESPVFDNISYQLAEDYSQPFLESLPNVVSESEVSLFEDEYEDNLPDLIIRCLKQFAQIPDNQEMISNNVVNFFEESHSSENPMTRFSSILSLLSIVFINDQQQLTEFFLTNINTLTELISNDQSLNVRCISVLLLGKILTHHCEFVSNDNLSQVMDFSIELLQSNETELLASICKMLSSIFTCYGEKYTIQIFDTVCPLLISLLDRPNIFEEPFLRFLNNAITSLLQSLPFSNDDVYDSYFNIYTDIGVRLENAINESEFPDQMCKTRMIGFLCSLIQYMCLNFKIVSNESEEDFFNFTSHILDILFELLSSESDMCENDALSAIATLVINDPTQVIITRLEQVAQTLVDIYLTADSPEIIVTTGGILCDLLLFYPDYFDQPYSTESEEEKSLAIHLLDATIKYFHTILLLPVQVRIFHIIGDILPRIQDDSDFAFADEIISGLNFLNYARIPKNDSKSNLMRLQSMLYVSRKLISRHAKYDPDIICEFYKNKRGILFAAALDVTKNKYQDETLMKYYLDFFDEILSLSPCFPKIFSIFSNYICRKDIKDFLANLPGPFEVKGKRMLIELKHKTK